MCDRKRRSAGRVLVWCRSLMHFFLIQGSDSLETAAASVAAGETEVKASTPNVLSRLRSENANARHRPRTPEFCLIDHEAVVDPGGPVAVLSALSMTAPGLDGKRRFLTGCAAEAGRVAHKGRTGCQSLSMRIHPRRVGPVLEPPGSTGCKSQLASHATFSVPALGRNGADICSGPGGMEQTTDGHRDGLD